MRKDVGIGEFDISNRSGDEIKTYALGSCVAVVVWDKRSKTGGMIHIALPESKINLGKANSRPGYFADTGLPLLFNTFKRKGGNLKSSMIKLAGGASMMDENRTFDIGRRNVIAAKRYLWRLGLGVVGEDTGGSISRTVTLEIETGKVLLNNSEKKWEL